MAEKKKTEKAKIESEESVKKEEKTEKKAEKAAKADEAQVEKLEKELAEANDKFLRTMAEYDNFRKRSKKEKEAIYSDSKAEIAAKFLPVLDNFERAAGSADDFESYKKGVEMTFNQLLEVFGTMGIESYGEKGDAFDPNFHNGVMHVEDEALGENSVAEVFLKGYKMGDKVIRHATVKVAN